MIFHYQCFQRKKTGCFTTRKKQNAEKFKYLKQLKHLFYEKNDFAGIGAGVF